MPSEVPSETPPGTPSEDVLTCSRGSVVSRPPTPPPRDVDDSFFHRTPAQVEILPMDTYTAPANAERSWYIVDATDRPLGRLASDIARVLRGKHRPTFTTNIDTGDFVIVINAEKVALTGSKLTKKFYYNYSGTIGGLRKRAVGDMLKHKPEFPVEKAVKGMLPHNSLGRAQGLKLKVYAGSEHPHAAQQPVALPLQF